MSAIPFIRVEVQGPSGRSDTAWIVFLLCWTGHWAELRRNSDGEVHLPSRRSALLVARAWARVLKVPIWLDGKPYA